MRYIPICLTVLSLAGCATVKHYESPSQAFRFEGDSKTTTITGRVDHKYGWKYEFQLHVFFDGQKVLEGPLDEHANGDVIGQEWKGKKVSASCSTRKVSSSWNETRCMVFHGNERTVTLTF